MFLLSAAAGTNASRRPLTRATMATVAALAPSVTRGYGAALPFTEYEAETAHSSGAQIGPSRTFTRIAAEASGRRAVRLDRRGQFVEFVLRGPADMVTLRSALPDSVDGHGKDATLSVLTDGRPAGRIVLTSRYGWFYGQYPFTNQPGDGTPHHFFDEARLRFSRTLPAGTVVRFAIAAGDDAPWYVLDLADFERVPPPLPQPAGSLSLLQFGGDATGQRSSADAFEKGIAAASRENRVLWIPPGTYQVERHIIIDRVRILGAGIFQSIVRGDGIGFYGKPAPGGSSGVELGQFAILGEVVDRVDDAQRNAIGGAMGGGSYLHDLLIQHHKVGLWFDGPMRGIRVSRLRVTDCTADGLNFHRGVSGAIVEDSFWRNTGDDGLAAWSQHDADHHLIFRRNTVVAPILANGVAIYGGHDIEISRNLIADVLTEGGGLHLGNRFGAVPASGRIDYIDNMVVRAGSFDPRWHFGVGALWFYALDAPIVANVRVSRTVIRDSSQEAVQFLGKAISGVMFDRLRVEKAQGGAFMLQAAGMAMIRNSRVTDVGAAAWRQCNPNFTLVVQSTVGLWQPHRSCPHP